MELGETFVKYLGWSVNNELVTGHYPGICLEQPRKAMKILSE
jgi:hypothetical protein